MSYDDFDLRIWVPVAIITFTCVLITITGVAVLSYQIKHEPLGQHLTKQDKLLSLCALTSFFMSILSDNLYVALTKLPDNPSPSIFELNLYTICNFFWALGYSLTYSLFWTRMQRCFESSMFKITNNANEWFYILVFMNFALQCIISLCWIPVTIGTTTWSDFSSSYFSMLWSRLVLDFMINFMIVYLFSSKLYKLILFTSAVSGRASFSSSPISLQKTSSESNATATDGNGDGNGGGHQSQKASLSVIVSTPTGDFEVNPDVVVDDMTKGANSDLFHLLIKQFFLSMITICSTQLFTIAEIAVAEGMRHAERTNHFDFYYAAYIPYHLCRSIDAVVSTVYILLSFHFNNKYYGKMCRFCQNRCTACWTKGVRAKIKANARSNAIETTSTEQLSPTV